MVDSMRAVVFHGPGRLELEQVPIPEPGPDDLLVRVDAATTCGTDAKTYRRGHHLVKPPSLFGHEFAGEVVEAGDQVETFQPGMRVVPHNSYPCGMCYFCKRNQENLCDRLTFNSGAYAEYAVIPGRIASLNTFQVPDHLSSAHASLLEPLVTVVHGQRVLGITPGETVAIIGAGGPIGLMHLQLSQKSGATKTIAVDLSDARLEVAERLGATHTINPNKTDPLSAILDLTDGRGVDVAIESAGAPEAWEFAVAVVRKGGRVLWFGGLKAGTPVNIDTHKVHYGELTLLATFHGTPLDVHNAFELLATGVIQAQPLITEELPLSQVEVALNKMIRGEVVKVAILPGLNE